MAGRYLECRVFEAPQCSQVRRMMRLVIAVIDIEGSFELLEGLLIHFSL